MSLPKSLLESLGVVLILGCIALGQEPTPPTAPQSPDATVQRDRLDRMERHRERMRRHEGRKGLEASGGEGRFISQLNLSDEQLQQRRAIIQRRLEATKSQREELFRLREKRFAGTFTSEDATRAKALHQELRTMMEGARTEIESVLTPEQKTKLEELKRVRKERTEQRLKERQERLQQRELRLRGELL